MNEKRNIYFPPINKLGNAAFREVCLIGGADFIFTEMINVEKLLSEDEIQLKKLQIPKSQQKNIIVQIICEEISNIEKAVDFIMKNSPFIKEINYNMGCPQSTLCKKECGAGIIGNTLKVQDVAEKLVFACNKYNILPSIKIRIGLKRDKITIYDNAKVIYDSGIKKLYIHGRTLDDTYTRPATYDEIKQTKHLFPKMQIIANGDVSDFISYEKILQTNCDGVLIGRAALENPYIFNELKSSKIQVQSLSGVELKSRKTQILEFLKYAEIYDLSINKIKLNLAYMTRSIIGANLLREKINDAKTTSEIIKIIKN